MFNKHLVLVSDENYNVLNSILQPISLWVWGIFKVVINSSDTVNCLNIYNR